MAIKKPYRRIWRPFLKGNGASEFYSRYMRHPLYAKSPEHYTRAFLLLQKDLIQLFEYIEPADTNLDCYSYRVQALLLRACIEVEANLKAILIENDYVLKKTKKGYPINLTMENYRQINDTHRLSSYKVKLALWHGNKSIRTPFRDWETKKTLTWYNAYNASKHNRHESFNEATFEHLIDAICGVFVLLSAQFGKHDFSISSALLAAANDKYNDDMSFGIGDYFRIKFPNNWTDEEKYDFDWQLLKQEADPFQNFEYK